MSFPESIPLRRDPQGAPSTVGAELAWLGLLIPLALVAILVLRRMKGQNRARLSDGASNPKAPLLGWLKRNAQSGLVLRASSRLTPNHSVHEIEWRGRTMLIGCSSQSIQLLGDMPLAAPGAATTASNSVSEQA